MAAVLILILVPIQSHTAYLHVTPVPRLFR